MFGSIILATLGIIILAGGMSECLYRNQRNSFNNTNNYNRGYRNNLEDSNITENVYYANVVYPSSQILTDNY